MNEEFLAERRPSSSLAAALAAQAPENPFAAPAYAAVRAGAGTEPWIIGLGRGGSMTRGCYGFISRGRLHSRFEIHSLPKLAQPGPFWKGLIDLCRAERITELQINSFASSETDIPDLMAGQQRRLRHEYRLDLTAGKPWQALSSNHRRNIKRARKAGLIVALRHDPNDVNAHVLAMAKSMTRRAIRGEQVTTATDAQSFRALIDHGAGQLFQAILEGQVMSSLLVLRAAEGAYYHSAGSSPEGMALGAAHFLVVEVAEQLRGQRLSLFNLGGADPDQEGLARFKAGFGTRRTDLQAARLSVCSPFRRYIYAVQRALEPAG